MEESFDWVDDTNLSLSAKGALAISLKHRGKTTNCEFISKHSSTGIDSTRSALNELYLAGYVTRVCDRDFGRITGVRYVISEKKSQSSPRCYESVYLLKFKCGHKIGYTRTVKSRMKGLASQYGIFSKRYVGRGNRKFERVLHKRFADKRIFGEFFDLTEQEVAECIKMMKENEK